MLGGADIQISAIKKAREMGYYVITCDYLPNNPGHVFANEYHNVSTTDKEAVLALARRLQIDGISAYASDPGALTAAYVSDELGLPGNTFNQVNIISDKFEFRTLQHKVGIAAPGIWEINNCEQLLRLTRSLDIDLIVKPVDTSGSKGIFKLKKAKKYDLEQIGEWLSVARSFSRSGRIVAEEFLQREGSLMSGDFFVLNGKIEFFCFGDVHFNTCVNGLVPRSISLPAVLPLEIQQKAIDDIQLVLNELHIEMGVFNMDVIKTVDGRVVCIDIGARNGGNMFNDIIHWHSGVDLIQLGLQSCLGDEVTIPTSKELMYCAHNVIHSDKSGILKKVRISNELRGMIRYEKLLVVAGDKVHRFEHSGHRCGLLLLEFSSFKEMHEILDEIHEHIVLELQE